MQTGTQTDGILAELTEMTDIVIDSKGCWSRFDGVKSKNQMFERLLSQKIIRTNIPLDVYGQNK